MTILAYVFSLLSLLLNGSLLVHLKPPYKFFFWIFQVSAAVLSPVLVILGLAGAVLGWMSDAPLALAAGVLGAATSAIYIFRVTAPQASFDRAFGENWEARIAQSRKALMLKRRWNIGWPRTRDPRWERDVPFWTIPEKDRRLLCDVWQPAEGVARTGVAIVYLHASAWWILDKDSGTRPFFRHLAAQGHVIMDVAYRLCPEVDIFEMVGDVKRAVAWMKMNAVRYQVSRDRIVLSGASAGGHLALLTAYTPRHPRFTPPDVQEADLSVRAVASYYGPTDLRACYFHWDQTRIIGLPRIAVGSPESPEAKKDMTRAGRLDTLLGGHLHEVPDIYDLASPVYHVSKESPPTLLVQGEPDVFTPAAPTRVLYHRLTDFGVPAANISFPMTEHAFDLILPKVSPPAHAALYYLERFLALMT